MIAPSGCLVALGSLASPVVSFRFCLNWVRSVLTVWELMERPSPACLSRFSMALRELVTLEERTDKGPETVKVVLAKEAEEWSR